MHVAGRKVCLRARVAANPQPFR
ncbi:hypothetical protein [Fimbriiglobus ruber]